YEANMDLVGVDPHLNLYDEVWPIRTYQGQYPPAKFVFADEFTGGRRGMALDSIISGGCIISGSLVQNCVLSPNVRIEAHAEVRDSVIMENVKIGERSRIRRAIIDKGVVIPPDTIIGHDIEHDSQRFSVTKDGVAVVTQDSPGK
ncbi:MAG TPA: glucose-1-phosphate adenylyltransferase, partial [Nitrospirales bacterium]|nr:glucose-1-phosphate adenylyltransferase [Nitrospirales bacterium]